MPAHRTRPPECCQPNRYPATFVLSTSSGGLLDEQAPAAGGDRRHRCVLLSVAVVAVAPGGRAVAGRRQLHDEAGQPGVLGDELGVGGVAGELLVVLRESGDKPDPVHGPRLRVLVEVDRSGLGQGNREERAAGDVVGLPVTFDRVGPQPEAAVVGAFGAEAGADAATAARHVEVAAEAFAEHPAEARALHPRVPARDLPAQLGRPVAEDQHQRAALVHEPNALGLSHRQVRRSGGGRWREQRERQSRRDQRRAHRGSHDAQPTRVRAGAATAMPPVLPLESCGFA